MFIIRTYILITIISLAILGGLIWLVIFLSDHLKWLTSLLILLSLIVIAIFYI